MPTSRNYICECNTEGCTLEMMLTDIQYRKLAKLGSVVHRDHAKTYQTHLGSARTAVAVAAFPGIQAGKRVLGVKAW